MREITFEIEQDAEDGSFSAAWPDKGVGGIVTGGESFEELRAMIKEAVELRFEGKELPAKINLHFVHDLALHLPDEVSAGH